MYKINDNIEMFKEVIKTSKTWAEAAKKMGYNSRNPYKYFQRKCKEYQIDYNHLLKRNNHKFSEKELKKIITKEKVEESTSVRNLIKNLGFEKDADKNGTLHRKVGKILGNFDTSHFTGHSWNKGKTKYNNESLKRQSEKAGFGFEEIFCKDSKYYGGGTGIIERLLEHKILNYECSKCKNNEEWEGEFLRLHLDHVNGINDDNRIENLRLLCPNCHSQTKTYCCSPTKKSNGREQDKLKILLDHLK